MNRREINDNTNECSIYGSHKKVKKHIIKEWFLEKIALTLALFELTFGIFSLIPSIRKKTCDSQNCTSISCQLMKDDNWIKRFIGNDLNVHGIFINGLLEIGELVFEEIREEALEHEEENKDDTNVLSNNIEKAKLAAINDLKRLGLIGEGYINFSVDDFKSIKLSINDIGNIQDLSQIYAYELAVRYYDSSSVDNFYRGIKCKFANRFFDSREDFIKSAGYNSEEEYERYILQYIEYMNGKIGIGGSCINDTRLLKYKYQYKVCDRGQSLENTKRKSKQILNKKII